MGCVNNSHSLRMIQFSDSLNFTVASAVSSCLEAATGGVLKNFSKFAGKHLCFPVHLLPCEFCEIFKNTYFIEHLRTTASDFLVET